MPRSKLDKSIQKGYLCKALTAPMRPLTQSDLGPHTAETHSMGSHTQTQAFGDSHSAMKTPGPVHTWSSPSGHHGHHHGRKEPSENTTV